MRSARAARPFASRSETRNDESSAHPEPVPSAVRTVALNEARVDWNHPKLPALLATHCTPAPFVKKPELFMLSRAAGSTTARTPGRRSAAPWRDVGSS